MHLEATRVTADNLDRVVALLHKTNQFNATMWRPSAAEVAAFVANDDNYAYAYRLTDRLGDAGIISVLLATTQETSAQIGAWVMSCRVFSRGVEWSIAQHLADWLAKQSVVEVSVGYVETPRNALVKGVLAALGADALGGPADAAETIYRAPAIKIPPHHVTVSER
jgi:FkbH-like protein